MSTWSRTQRDGSSRRASRPAPRAGRARSHRGMRLFAVYAAASLVPVVALGIVLTRGYHDGGRTHALDQGRAQAAVIEQMAVAPALTGADLDRGLDEAERDRLQRASDLALFHGSVVRLRVMSFEGRVVFSDDGDLREAVPTDDPAFVDAVAGRVHAGVSSTGDGYDGATIRVLQPVVPEATGRATGVLEVVLPYDEIASRVRTETRQAILRLALGLVVLYGVLALISFVTTRALRRYAAHNEHQALHDSLTGLANRELFRRVAEQELTRSRAYPGAGGALVLVDLDHFKEVNDTLGHHAGDHLLAVVAQRLSESLRTDDTVARLGGDEFGIVLPGSGREETVELLRRVRRELCEPVTIEHTTLSVEASFGVCFLEDADSVEGLLQHADVAMYRGKHGPDGVVVFDATQGTTQGDALVVQGELRRALDEGEFVLHYQPKVDLGTGDVSGVEALIRWQHPVRGLVPPGDFLPVAERSELIVPLTRWVVRRAIEDLQEWTAAGIDWTVSVNVSARNLGSTAFVDDVVQLLDATGVPAERLLLEVTETAVAFDLGVVREVVQALSARGIGVALDDFGVGYTAISQLRTLSMAELKIDRLFITGLDGNEQDRAIVRSVVALAHSLGCTVTAEGVETPAVADWLRASGCDHAQGYFWLRPMPWRDVVTANVTAAETARRDEHTSLEAGV